MIRLKVDDFPVEKGLRGRCGGQVMPTSWRAGTGAGDKIGGKLPLVMLPI